MRESIGTSLFVITLQSFAGFAGHVTHVRIDWTLMLGIAGAAAAGSMIGASASRRIAPARLRRAFAWLVIAMGLFMFVRQLPAALAIAAALLTILAAFLTRRTRRSATPPPSDEALRHYRSSFPRGDDRTMTPSGHHE
jgi:hypothetical protein